MIGNVYRETGRCVKTFVSISNLIFMENLISPFVIFKGQRPFDEKRINDIVDYQLLNIQKYGEPIFTGNIIFCYLNNVYHLIDGQHRYFSAKKLFELTGINFEFSVDIIKVLNEFEMQNEFVVVNKCVPVPLIFLEPDEIINHAIDSLYTQFPKNFTQGNSRPKININIFKSSLKEYLKDNNIDLCNNLHISTPEDLKNKILKLNTVLIGKGHSYIHKKTHKNSNTKIAIDEKNKIKEWFLQILISKENNMMFGIYKSSMYITFWKRLYDV